VGHARVEHDGGQVTGVPCPPYGAEFLNRCYRISIVPRYTVFVLLAPHQLIFSALEGALVDSRTNSFAKAEEALSELARRNIPLVLVTSRTRTEIEPLRRKIEHNHPFITESGGGIFFPDGYFNVKIPGATRNGRYLCISLGKPYKVVCEALDDLSEETGVGVAGFHHMSPREIADNTGMRLRDVELARNREYDEPFFFTSADEKAIAGFVDAAKQQGFQARPGGMFWHFSGGSDTARAVRSVTGLFREATRIRLRAVGIGGSEEDLGWLRTVDQAILLPGNSSSVPSPPTRSINSKSIAQGDIPGPAGWNAAILNIIG
jgi:mannosyl-3-phosphoglycerate phosphatase